jgi:hypothetical protein
VENREFAYDRVHHQVPQVGAFLLSVAEERHTEQGASDYWDQFYLRLLKFLDELDCLDVS